MSAKTLLRPAAEMVKANHAHVLNESKEYRPRLVKQEATDA
jgi:hypothetical protein